MTNLEYETKIAPLRGYVYSIIYRKVKNDASLAEDLTQKTLIKAFKYFQNSPIRNATYKTLLNKISNHVIIDYYGKYKHLNLLNDLAPELDENESCIFEEADFSSNHIDKMVTNDIINTSLEELKKHNYQLFETFIDAIDDVPYFDIAQKNNIPENTVKTRVFRARQFLKKYLESKNICLESLSIK